MPEFMIIAVVALVVLGPERLPDLMRRAGRAYRQMREMSSQLTGEFQRQLEEGMKEVEEVSATVNSAWQDATSDDASSNAPPPRLRQVPPSDLPASTQADAGPWALAAWYRDSRAEPEPQGMAYPASPTALPRRQAAVDPVLDDIGALGDLDVAAVDGLPLRTNGAGRLRGSEIGLQDLPGSRAHEGERALQGRVLPGR